MLTMKTVLAALASINPLLLLQTVLFNCGSALPIQSPTANAMNPNGTKRIGFSSHVCDALEP